MIDEGAHDEKIIAIPFGDPGNNSYHDIADLPDHIFKEMLHFFSVYKDLEGKSTVANQVYGREEAEKVITKAITNYQTHYLKGR